MRAPSLGRRFVVFLMVGFAAWVPTGAVRADEQVPTDQMLPPHVVAYMTIPSVDSFKEAWGESSYGKLFDEPGMKAARDAAIKQIEEQLTQLESETGIGAEELLNVPSGEVAIAVTYRTGQRMGVVVFLDFGESGEAVDTLLEKLSDGLEEEGHKASEDEFEDTTITTFQREAQEGENGAGPRRAGAWSSLSWFVKDTFLVLSNQQASLESVLVRWDGEHDETFADNEAYSYIVERCSEPDSEALLYWYVDPMGIYQAAIAEAGPAGQQLAMGMMMVPVLGLDKLKAIGGSIDMATETYDSVTKMLAYVEGEPRGVLAALRFPAVDQTPPSWISEETTRYFAVNWDLDGAYKAIEGLVDGFQGPGAFQRMMDNLAQADGRLHPKTDVIDALSGSMHVAIDVPDPENPLSTRVLLALGLKNPEKMKGVLSKLAETPNFPGKVREFQGTTLYEMPLQGGAGSSAVVAVARDHLFFSSKVELAEQAIRRDSDRKGLADSETFQKLAEETPEKTSILGYSADDGQMRVGYERLRKQGASGDGFDFSKLPEFSVIQKYLRPSMSYAVPDKRGVLFVTFTLAD